MCVYMRCVPAKYSFKKVNAILPVLRDWDNVRRLTDTFTHYYIYFISIYTQNFYNFFFLILSSLSLSISFILYILFWFMLSSRAQHSLHLYILQHLFFHSFPFSLSYSLHIYTYMYFYTHTYVCIYTLPVANASLPENSKPVPPYMKFVQPAIAKKKKKRNKTYLFHSLTNQI